MRALIISILVLISGFAFSPAVSAVNIVPGCNGASATSLSKTSVCKSVNSQTGSSSDPILRTLKTTIDIISLIIGVAAIIVLIVAGIQFIVGGGSPQSIATARNSLIYALVGVFVAVLAQSIVVFVIDNVLK